MIEKVKQDKEKILQEKNTNKKQEKIIVIDDSSFVHAVIKGMLQQYNFEVLIAHDGEEGWQIVQDQYKTLKLIIVDCEMPKKSGFQVCNEIRKMEKLLEISDEEKIMIILNSGSANDIREEALEAGANEYFQKPFTTQMLKNVLLKLKLIPAN